MADRFRSSDSSGDDTVRKTDAHGGAYIVVICVGVTSIWIVCLLMIMCLRIQMRENLLWLDEEWIAREMRFFTGFVGYRYVCR